MMTMMPVYHLDWSGESSYVSLMNPIHHVQRILYESKQMYDLSVRAQSPFAECFVIFLHRKQDFSKFWLVDVTIQS